MFRPNRGSIRFDPVSGMQDSLGWFKGGENFVIKVGGRSHVMVPPGHRRTVETWSSRFVYIADTERYEIHTFDLDSGQKSLIRRNVPNPPFTSQDREAYLTMYSAYMEQSPRDRASLERWLAEVPFPETKPAIEALRADRGGRLWVQEPTANSDDLPRWMVYSADGRLLGEARLPQNFNPMDIGDDYVLGVWRDEDNVEFVHVYGLGAPDRP